ncbi:MULTISPECIES: hypothetical protein [Pseudoalteromonas]|uniref:IrrE N-terminal-like domain-containing protein n=1 Tax=Pseudoalteromonas amylolytica TaxID=1859457 RepID=A0A1S1MYA3_9GAMM|nr:MULTISPECIES: hypothetical protein [Pseudoalteromonas]OHU89148.1 hypothetical protein BFC16_05740 [Pseudoalteromonas sp. JW3]OHU92048.1 hypothetical protein BET10_06845 [Pseudoalteromonas amylolytica]
MHASVLAILDFLEHIGIPHEVCSIEQKTFLPGLRLKRGVLQIDAEKLLYPGDILHEAGHLAVCEPTERHMMSDDVYKSGRNQNWMQGEEMAAIAWSVAASRFIGLPLDVVFHPHGYKGASDHFIKIFSEGEAFGTPLLKAWDMVDPDLGFPFMKCWLRELSWY